MTAKLSPVPAQSDVERAFTDALSAMGFLPGSLQVDTKDFVRFDAPGDKKGRQNGFYKLKLGRFPVGWFGDWKSGEQHQWHYDDGRELTSKERADIKAEQRRLKIEADVARETRQLEVAENASQIFGRASTDIGGHPYLERKNIDVPRGLKLHIAKGGERLLAVPMSAFDLHGGTVLTNLQMISPDGEKRFLKAGRVEGAFFAIKGDTQLTVICEGTATGFAIWRATGASIVVAFNSGNLIAVAKAFAQNRPLATYMIAGDDDVMAPDDWRERGRGRPWVNSGRLKAEAAAKAIGCRWLLPVFAEGPARSRTDFDDLRAIEGEHAVAAQIMGAMRSIEAEDAAPGAKLVQVDFVQDETWRQRIPTTSTGTLDGNNVEGVALYIEHHKLLRARLGFNAFTQATELDGHDMADHHVSEFRRIMHAERFKAKKGDVADEMLAEARRNTYDPLSDYLGNLKWDGRERVDTWLVDYLGAPDTDYSRDIGRKFLIGAAARALHPGCKNDTMVVLEGPQGTGKSTALRYLFNDRFFIDHLPDFHSKDAFMQLQGAWCVEVAELSAYGKADVKDVKQFLSRLVDKYRPPFGKMTISVPRRVVLVATVNPEDTGYLRDPTGARRFWPTATGTIRLDAILRDRDQLWAEAVQAFKDNEQWYLSDPDAIASATEQQEARRERDPWEEPIRLYIAEHNCEALTAETVLTSILRVLAEKQTPVLARRAGACLRALKWSPKAGRVPGVSKTVKIFRPPDWSDS